MTTAPRIATTTEELIALPVGTVFLDGEGDAARIGENIFGLHMAAYCGVLNPDKLPDVPLPVTVLWTPGAKS